MRCLRGGVRYPIEKQTSMYLLHRNAQETKTVVKPLSRHTTLTLPWPKVSPVLAGSSAHPQKIGMVTNAVIHL